MSWADNYIKDLKEGKVVQFRPRGNSMTGKVNDGQLVTVTPGIAAEQGNVVLCKVSGQQYLHLVKAIGSDGRLQIGNNKGHINGWTTPENVFGVVTKIED